MRFDVETNDSKIKGLFQMNANNKKINLNQ